MFTQAESGWSPSRRGTPSTLPLIVDATDGGSRSSNGSGGSDDDGDAAAFFPARSPRALPDRCGDAPYYDSRPQQRRPYVATAAAAAAQRRDAFLCVLWRDLFPGVVAGYLTAPELATVAALCRGARAAVGLPCVWRTVAAAQFGVCAAAVDDIARRRAPPRLRPERSPSAAATPTEGALAQEVVEEGAPPIAGSGQAAALDSQLPTPCEGGASSPKNSACGPPSAAVSPREADSAGVGVGVELPSPLAGAAPPPAAAAAGGAPPAVEPFPWAAFTKSLHHHRVGAVLDGLRRLERAPAPAPAARGEVEVEVEAEVEAEAEAEALHGHDEDVHRPGPANAARDDEEEEERQLAWRLRVLTRSINALCQRGGGGGCSDSALLQHLAKCLEERGRLLLHLHERQQRQGEEAMGGGAELAVAIEDLAAAEVLNPNSAGLRALVVGALRAAEGGDGGRGTLWGWVAAFDSATHLPRPLAALGVLRRAQHNLLPPPRGADDDSKDDGDDADSVATEAETEQQRRQRLLLLLLAYLHIAEVLGVGLEHLLVSAAAVAADAVEHRLVQALRLLRAPGGAAAASAAADVAANMLPRAARAAAEAAAPRWVRDWVLCPQVTLEGMVGEGLCAPAASPSDREGDAEAALLASLVHFVLAAAATQELTGMGSVLYGFGLDREYDCSHRSSNIDNSSSSSSPRPLPVSTSTADDSLGSSMASVSSLSGCGSYSSADCAMAVVRCLALSRCRRHQATALCWLSRLFDRPGAAAAGLPIPPGAPQMAVPLRLLHAAVHIAPLHVPAHVALSRLYVRRWAGEMGPALSCTAYDLLAACIHRHAVPFLSGECGVRRRDRGPDRCFVPAELLCERSRLARSGAPLAAPAIGARGHADLLEAIAQDPRLAYPHRVRAAVAIHGARSAADGGDDAAAAARAAEADREVAQAVGVALHIADVRQRLRWVTERARGEAVQRRREWLAHQARHCAGLLLVLEAAAGGGAVEAAQWPEHVVSEALDVFCANLTRTHAH